MRAERWSDRQFIGAAVLAVFLFALLFQGSRPLLDPDEGRYTAVALEMLRSGDFLHPALGPEHPHLTKPALTYWIIAGSIAVFGQNEWAARLPYALAFALTAGLIAGIAGTLRLRNARWGPGVYALMFWPFLSANIITTDVFLTLFETLGAWGYVRLWRAESRDEAARARLVLALGFGLAFFTKGPPGLLPLAAFAVHAFWRSRWQGLRALFDWVSVLVFLALAFGWYAVLILRDPALLDYLLHNEVVGRLAGEHKRNPQFYRAFVIYGPTLILGSLPWAGYWLRDAWRCSRARAAGDDLRRFVLLWFGLPLIVFVLAKSRLVMYVLPLFAPLALWVLVILEGRPLPTWLRRGLPLWILFLVVFKAVLAYQPLREYAGPLASQLRVVAQDAEYERIATVGTKSHYGLRFYTRKIVEHHFYDSGDEAAVRLCQRFNAVPVSRAAFVNPALVESFKAAVTGCGWQLDARGEVDRMQLFLVSGTRTP